MLFAKQLPMAEELMKHLIFRVAPTTDQGKRTGADTRMGLAGSDGKVEKHSEGNNNTAFRGSLLEGRARDIAVKFAMIAVNKRVQMECYIF